MYCAFVHCIIVFLSLVFMTTLSLVMHAFYIYLFFALKHKELIYCGCANHIYSHDMITVCVGYIYCSQIFQLLFSHDILCPDDTYQEDLLA